MTSETRAGGPQGTVFDIGYQSYGGPREGRGRSRFAIYKDGLRAALGLGRGGRAKILPWFFIILLGGIGLIFSLFAGLAYQIAGSGAADALNLPSHADFYGFAATVFFVFAAVCAPELLCPDRREGTIHLYLVRPISSTDYVFGRWFAFFTVMIAVAWIPQILLLLGLALGNPEPAEYLVENWLDVPRFLAAGAAFAAYTTSLAMLVASFTTRRAYAAVFLVGLFFITTPFTTVLAFQLGDAAAGQWISMFNLTNIPVHVNDVIFGETSAITSIAPAREFGSTALVAWYFLWTLGPIAILWRRYRRLVA
jgi:ABC-2 type transport system permease protein